MKSSTQPAPRWSNLRFGTHPIKFLNVSRLKGNAGRWPEVILLQVPGPAKKKLLARNALRDLLNEHKVFSKPARKLTRSVTLPGVCKIWYFVVLHSRTSTLIVVCVPGGR
jgi:hypothetical protein